MRQTVFEETLDGITIDRVIRDYEYNMPTKHVHDEYEIYYLVKGERYYFIGQHTYHIHEGCLVFIDRNEIHKTGMAGGAGSYHDRILIEFREEPFRTFFQSLGDLNLREFFRNNSGVIELDVKAAHHVEGLLLSIQSEIHKKLPGYRMSVMSKLSSLLIYAMRYGAEHNAEPMPSSATAKHKKVDEVASFIVEHCAEPLSLESVAGSFFVNKCYLSRIFKEVTGFTVNEYINIHRISAAQKLLAESNMTITEIAGAVGYESLTYFEKVFRTYREVSPLKYRNEYCKQLRKRSKKVEKV